MNAVCGHHSEPLERPTNTIIAEKYGHLDAACRSCFPELFSRPPTKTVHDVMTDHGVDRERLHAALASNDNWGAMVHAYEFLTAASAVLATWPTEETP